MKPPAKKLGDLRISPGLTAAKRRKPLVDTTIAVAATFTSEPIEGALAFWMKRLSVPAKIEFAPFNQVFQQLLDPASAFSVNSSGVNVLLLRLEDWLNLDTLPAAQIRPQ